MYSEITVSKLNDIAHRFKELVHRSIHAVLSQPPYKNTGAGAASLTVDVIDGDRNKAPQIVIHFDDHLIFLDKRKMQWTKLPEMRSLVAWAETKKSTKAEAEQLAWAVGWNQKKTDAWKPKPSWRKKSLSVVLKEMNTIIVKAFDDAIQEEFDNAVKV